MLDASDLLFEPANGSPQVLHFVFARESHRLDDALELLGGERLHATGDARGGHHGLHHALVLHQLEDPRIAHELQTAIQQGFFEARHRGRRVATRLRRGKSRPVVEKRTGNSRLAVYFAYPQDMKLLSRAGSARGRASWGWSALAAFFAWATLAVGACNGSSDASRDDGGSEPDALPAFPTSDADGLCEPLGRTFGRQPSAAMAPRFPPTLSCTSLFADFGHKTVSPSARWSSGPRTRCGATARRRVVGSELPRGAAHRRHALERVDVPGGAPSFGKS